jgi:hypothetical protein
VCCGNVLREITINSVSYCNSVTKESELMKFGGICCSNNIGPIILCSFTAHQALTLKVVQRNLMNCVVIFGTPASVIRGCLHLPHTRT